MARFSSEEHMRRKKMSAIRCLDENGKPVSEESKSVAVQDKRDQCDINRITKKLVRPDGQVDMMALAAVSKGPGRFVDVTGAVDYQESQNRVIRMNSLFMTLDPQIRFKFENNPIKLVEYLDKARIDKDTKKEAIELGLLPKPVFKTQKLETPTGDFWVTTEDGVEINREPVKTAAPAPGA